ncbi:MAG TPA: hypothetical protein VHN79_05890 [Lacunisphaera sp.]|nr:hypothetical protein [Lacunisphaera sp.]
MMCFLGHGTYGILTKAAWVPYFGVVGLPEAWAWRLMPWVGAMDIAIGFLVLVWPCRALFLWAAAWAAWTALLRPLAGQGWPEFFERAGNYGVPVALLAVVGFGGKWFARLSDHWPELSTAVRRRLMLVLRVTAATLLAGHATCALILQKPGLAQHYQVLGTGNPVAVMLGVGWFEIALAGAVLVVRVPAVFVLVCAWKVATELLFLTSGAPAPLFEVIERGGSYLAPLALAYLLARPSPAVRLSSLQPA